MRFQHRKSTCCRALVVRHGGKRRRCSQCRRTWSIRPKRRGPKPLRADRSLIESYFEKERAAARIVAKRRGTSRSKEQRSLRRSLSLFITHQLPTWTEALPKHGPLIAVPDGIWYRVGRRREKRTAYLILLRPVEAQEAVIAPPLVLTGHEDLLGWEAAFAALPESLRKRIQAIVCDGGMGVVAFARKQPWHLQRCHFHLLANLMMYRNPTLHPELKPLFDAVRMIISTTDQKAVRRSMRRIEAERDATTSPGVKRILSGLLTNYRDFQTYVRHPEFNLPRTTNAAESCVSRFQELKKQLRGFRSEEAMHEWLTGYALWKKTIACRGEQTQK